MTGALEKAARALVASTKQNYDDFNEASRENYLKHARAVLLAVLPTLGRLDIDRDGDLYPHPEGDVVLFADLEAILNEEPK